MNEQQPQQSNNSKTYRKYMLKPSLISALVMIGITYFLLMELMLDELISILILGIPAIIILFFGWKKSIAIIKNINGQFQQNKKLNKRGKKLFIWSLIPVAFVAFLLLLFEMFYEASVGGEEGYFIAFVILLVLFICIPMFLIGIWLWNISNYGWKKTLRIYLLILESLFYQFLVILIVIIIYEQLIGYSWMV